MTRAHFKSIWHRIPKTVRKPLVLMIGSAIVVAGIVMLVTPGPGWAGIFLGFAVLATEFAFAERVRDWLVGQLKRLIRYAEQKWNRLKARIKHK